MRFSLSAMECGAVLQPNLNKEKSMPSTFGRGDKLSAFESRTPHPSEADRRTPLNDHPF